MPKTPILGHPIIDSMIYGILGGILYCLVSKWGWKEAYEWPRRILIGAILGIIYPATGLPNHFAVAMLAYSGLDVIEAFMSRRGHIPSRRVGHDNS